MSSLALMIPILYAGIHMLEFMSYLSRIAGLVTGYKLLSYSIQQMFFVITRFLFTALMPTIGFLVDNKINTYDFLCMVHFSLFLASLLYIVVFLNRRYIVNFIIILIKNKKKEGEIIINNNYMEKMNISYYTILNNKKKVFYSAVVFLCYGLGIFIAFYFSIIFYEYRVTISQLSGLVNGFATILLTFYIEPKLAEAFDESKDSSIQELYSVLFGRFVAIAILSHIAVVILSVFTDM